MCGHSHWRMPNFFVRQFLPSLRGLGCLWEECLTVFKALCKRLYRYIKKEPYWLVSLAAAGMVVAVRQTGALQPFELMAFDYQVRLEDSEIPDPRLLVVEVTEKDIRNLNQWPMTDETLSTVLNTLQAYSPRAVGLDIYRDVPVSEGQAALEQAMRSPNFIAIYGLGISVDDSVPAPASIQIVL